MQIQYDVEKIKKFLKDFHSITGLTVSIWDTNIRQLAHEPEVVPEFCRRIQASPLGQKRCLLSDQSICGTCRTTLAPAFHRCHAGLIDTAIPILLDGRLFGFMMFGQIQGGAKDQLTEQEITHLANTLGIPANTLYVAYRNLQTFDRNRIRSASRILMSAAVDLFDSGSIRYTENEWIATIQEYIKNNLSHSISVAEICARFGIPKTKLYMLWNEKIGVPIGKYILNLRMDTAKEALRQSDKKIHEISDSVGISDYNYFSKLFKKYYAVSPKAYRKQITSEYQAQEMRSNTTFCKDVPNSNSKRELQGTALQDPSPKNDSTLMHHDF